MSGLGDRLRRAVNRGLEYAVRAADIQTATYVRRELTGHDPATGQTTTTEDNLTVDCVLSRYQIDQAALSDGRILVGDLRMLVGAADLGGEPDQLTDRVVIDGREHRLMSVEPLGLDEPRLYLLQLRG